MVTNLYKSDCVDMQFSFFHIKIIHMENIFVGHVKKIWGNAGGEGVAREWGWGRKRKLNRGWTNAVSAQASDTASNPDYVVCLRVSALESSRIGPVESEL